MDRWFNKDLERKDLPKNVNSEELYGFLNDNKVLEDEKYVAIYEDLLKNEEGYERRREVPYVNHIKSFLEKNYYLMKSLIIGLWIIM